MPNKHTFKDQILCLQVKSLSVALFPQSGDGGVELPTAEGLHGRGRRQEVPLSPQQQRLAAPPLHISLLWQHAKREVVVGDVNVPGVVSFVGVILAALPVPPSVSLVPVVSADRDCYQSQSAKSQKEPRHG